MSRTASYIDFKRIQKNYKLYNLSQETIENIYQSGLMTISSNDSFSFCYPINYWDGILIRYNSSNIINSVDMLIELSKRLPGRIYISDIDDNLGDFLSLSGFQNHLKIYSVYKKNSYLPKKTGDFHIISYSQKYYSQLKSLDQEVFCFPIVTSSDNFAHFTKNNYSKVKLCVLDDSLCGFCLYMFKPEAMYFYIIKLYVSVIYRRNGAGTLLLKSVIEDAKKYGYSPIFSDVFSDDAQQFLNYSDFTTWAESTLLIKP